LETALETLQPLLPATAATMSDSGDNKKTAAVLTEEEKLRDELWDKIGHIAAAHIGPDFERTDCSNTDKWLSKTISELEEGIAFCNSFEADVSSAAQCGRVATFLTDVASGINEDLGTAFAKAVTRKITLRATLKKEIDAIGGTAPTTELGAYLKVQDLKKAIDFCQKFEPKVAAAHSNRNLVQDLIRDAAAINSKLGTAVIEAFWKRSALAEIPRITTIVYKIEDSGLAHNYARLRRRRLRSK
jgi:hypothetical protein